MSNETISDDVNKLHEELLETSDNHSVVLSAGFVRKLLKHYQTTKELRSEIEGYKQNLLLAQRYLLASSESYDAGCKVIHDLLNPPLPTKGDE